MPSSSFLIGSHANIPETTVTVVANSNSEDLTFPAGSYYVHDTSSSRSALTTLASLIATHGDLSSCTGTLQRNRYINLTANAAFTASFDDTTLMDVLGITANFTTSQASQTAQGYSGYMFVPGKMPIEDGRPGTQGFRAYDTSVGQAGPGQVVSYQRNYHTKNGFEWRFVDNDRVWTASELAGEWVSMFRNVLRRFYKIKHYAGLENDEASTAAIDLSSVTTQGPYIMDPGRGAVMESYEKGIGNIYDYLDHCGLKVVSTSEYS